MAENKLTTNVNFLSPIGFKITINRERYANTEYFITSFGIPDISSSEVPMQFRGGIAYNPGETREFGALNLRFVIDEDMKNYTEIYDWMEDNTNKVQRSDIILSVMSAHNKVNKQFQFKNAFPTSLSGVEFNAQLTDVEYLQADVTFRYDEFTIIK